MPITTEAIAPVTHEMKTVIRNDKNWDGQQRAGFLPASLRVLRDLRGELRTSGLKRRGT